MVAKQFDACLCGVLAVDLLMTMCLFALDTEFYLNIFSTAAPSAPTTSTGIEMDLLGSLSESFSSNALALVPAESTNATSNGNPPRTTSSEPTFAASPAANQVGFDLKYALICAFLFLSMLINFSPHIFVV